jgi:putative oxidoreductase
MSGLLEVLNPLGPTVLLFIRLVVGVRLGQSGYRRLKGGGLSKSEQWMQTMNIPPIAADLVTVLEVLGGAFLVVGLLTPVVGLFFTVEFSSIIWMKKSKMHATFASREPGKPTYELETLFLLLSLIFLVFGAGQYSVDYLVGL